jgi:hypothetical protein
VPQEYLEQFSIRGRARLEMVADGILIRPVENNAQGLAAQADEAALETNQTEAHGLRAWWQRWRDKGRASQ